MNNLKKTSKIGKVARDINLWSAIIMLIAMVFIIGLNVVMRYIFNIAFRWSEEIVVLLFVYLIFLAIPVALRENSHVKIEYFALRFNFKLRKIIDLIIDVIMLIIFIFFIKIGVDLVFKIGASPMPATYLPKGLLYIAVPISSLIMIIDMIVLFIKHLQEQEG
jgi:TRAP-type C4-dicarboxylate transport system permease small subunit